MIAEIKYHRNFDKSMKSDIETREPANPGEILKRDLHLG